MIEEVKNITYVEAGWKGKAQNARRGFGIFFLIMLIILIVVMVYFCTMKRKQNRNLGTIKKL